MLLLAAALAVAVLLRLTRKRLQVRMIAPGVVRIGSREIRTGEWPLWIQFSIFGLIAAMLEAVIGPASGVSVRDTALIAAVLWVATVVLMAVGYWLLTRR